MTPLERAAKAAWLAFHRAGRRLVESEQWPLLDQAERTFWIEAQRAALLALAEAEPSGAMNRAGRDALLAYGGGTHTMFAAMLRAAAEEK